MTDYIIDKVTAVPSTPTTPNTLFFVANAKNPQYTELYVSSNTGAQLRRLPNEADITAIATALMSGMSKYKVVEDINERDSLGDTGVSVFVKDATGDLTVNSGGAFYIHDGYDWVKVSETESMDIALNWGSITGKPTSTPQAIDTAVSQAHTHANKTELDKIGQDREGNLTYGGKKVGGLSGVANW